MPQCTPRQHNNKGKKQTNKKKQSAYHAQFYWYMSNEHLI
jgi:hypothetical protein